MAGSSAVTTLMVTPCPRKCSEHEVTIEQSTAELAAMRDPLQQLPEGVSSCRPVKQARQPFTEGFQLLLLGGGRLTRFLCLGLQPPERLPLR